MVCLMGTLAVLIFVWALVFAMLFLPARKVGAWIARPPDGRTGTTLSVLLCWALALAVVLSGWLALKIGGSVVFPYIDPLNFRLPLVAVVLFAPAFAAL